MKKYFFRLLSFLFNKTNFLITLFCLILPFVGFADSGKLSPIVRTYKAITYQEIKNVPSSPPSSGSPHGPLCTATGYYRFSWSISGIPANLLGDVAVYENRVNNPKFRYGPVSYWPSGYFNMVIFQGWIGDGPCTDQMVKDNTRRIINDYDHDYYIIANYTNPDGTQGTIESHPFTGTNNNSPLTPKDLVSPEKTTFTKDPINIATGESFFSSNDFSIKARGPSLTLSRNYRSFSKLNGMFGYGWRTDYDSNLITDPDGNVFVFEGNGTGMYFLHENGIYIPSDGNYTTLIKDSESVYTLNDKYGTSSQYINGRLSTRVDRNGNKLTFVYNPSIANGTYIQDASGRKIILNFDTNKRVTSARDPAGNLFQYVYDLNGNLIQITDPTNAVTKYQYDSNHKIIKVINANGHNTYFQYDSQGRAVINWQDNNVNKITLDYQVNNTTLTTDSLGQKNTYVFNDYGLLLSHTDPLGNVTKQSWDYYFNKTSITDAKSNKFTFKYDPNGNLIHIYKSGTAVVTDKMTYTSDFNQISSYTNYLGQKTTYEYDTKGNLIKIIDALGNVNSFTYDQYGNLTKITNTLGNSTSFVVNNYGQVTQKTDALGNKTLFTYDLIGNNLSQKDALNRTTSFQYNKLNRPIKITLPSAAIISNMYDLFGNLISVTDPKGGKITKSYDFAERLSQIKDPNGKTTQFNYDTEGRLLKITDANGRQTTFTYNANGNMLSSTNALNLTTKYSYDPMGNVISKTNENGNIITYSYDPLNQLNGILYPDSNKITSVNSSLGYKVTMKDSRGTTLFRYDDLNRLISRTDPGSYQKIQYTYDSEGNLLKIIDQHNRTITYSYDALNRLKSVTDLNGVTSYDYDAVSNKTFVKMPNGVISSYTYDALNRVLSVKNTKDAVIISLFNNTYDNAGMITNKSYSDGSSVTYSYDALNQLLKETKQKNGSTIYDYSFTYDSVGNRLSWIKKTTLGGFWSTDSLNMPAQVLTSLSAAGFGTTANQAQSLSLTRNYIYDGANRLSNWEYSATIGTSSFPIETNTYTYDNNGNRISKQKIRKGQESTPQLTTYSYNFENQLNKLQYTNIPGITSSQIDTFVYSGDGLRTQSVINGANMNYLYDRSNLLLERTANVPSTSTVKTYTRGLDFGGGIGSLISQNIGKLSTSVVQYYNYDNLGSVSNLTTSTGAVANTYNYDAFGNLLAHPVSGDTNRYLFSTKEFEARSGLYYFGERYYDPEVGRWLTPDPLGFIDGLNLYLYVNNNPVNFVDPTGEFAIALIPLVYGAIEIGFSLADAYSTASTLFDSSAGGKEKAMSAGLFIAGALLPGGGYSTAGKAIAKNAESATYLYQKVNKTGKHLKFGITGNPATRYTKEQLQGGKLKILASGNRDKMLKLERDLHSHLPIGPEEGQSIYTNIQHSLGYKIPPY